MSNITIIGLGPGPTRHLTVAARRALLLEKPLFFKTKDHPAALYCRRRRVHFQALDRFAAAPRLIGPILLSAAGRHSRIGYALPGHPLEGILRLITCFAGPRHPGTGLKLSPESLIRRRGRALRCSAWKGS